MRLILRIFGTWLIGLAVVLLVVDGTKSLAANEVVLTPFYTTWAQLHEASLIAVRDFLGSRLFAAMLDPLLTAVLSFPSFAVLGVPGIVFALLGREPTSRQYIRQDQF